MAGLFVKSPDLIPIDQVDSDVNREKAMFAVAILSLMRLRLPPEIMSREDLRMSVVVASWIVSEEYLVDHQGEWGVLKITPSLQQSISPPKKRSIRPAVLWRKMGGLRAKGARYGERALTASAISRLQGRSVIEFLREACRYYQQNLPLPSLIG